MIPTDCDIDTTTLRVTGVPLTLLVAEDGYRALSYDVEVCIVGSEKAVHDAHERVDLARTPLADGAILVDRDHPIGQVMETAMPQFGSEPDDLAAKWGVWLDDGNGSARELLNGACIVAADIVQRQLDDTSGGDHCEVRSVRVTPSGPRGAFEAPADA